MGLNDGLQALYHFTGNANDSSGNGNDGTVTGATLTTDKNGVSNQAYDFSNSANDVINLGIPYEINTNPLSINFWVKAPDQGAQNWLIENRNVGVSANRFGIWSNITTSNKIDFYTNNGSSSNTLTSISTVFDNNWHMITITRDSSGVNKIYVDGVFEVASTLSGDISQGQPWNLGKYGADALRSYTGIMDEVRIYNRVLSEYEILQLYVGYDSEDDFVQTLTLDNIFYHKLDEDSVTQTDATGNGYNTIQNNMVYTSSGIINGAYISNGLQYMTIADAAELDPVTSQVATWNCWMYQTTSTNGGLWGKRQSTEQAGAYSFTTNADELQFNFYSGSAASQVLVTTNANLVINTWYMLTVIMDANANTCKIYKNGVLLTPTGSITNNFVNNTHPFYINSVGQTLGGAGRQMTGILDEMSMWSRALTQEEIDYLYNSGTPTEAQQYPYEGATPEVVKKNALFFNNNF